MVLWLLWLLLAPALTTARAAERTQPLDEAEKARLALDRLGYGARPGEIQRVAAIGVDNWIRRQLDPGSIPDTALAERLEPLQVPDLSTAEVFDRYPSPASIRRGMRRGGRMQASMAGSADASGAAAEDDVRRTISQTYRRNPYGSPREIYLQLAADRLLRATYSERQLQEVMVDFWCNHFNVYARKNVLAWYIPEYVRETIRPHALGKFRDLLLATAQSPAMLFYLDNFQSVSPDAASDNARVAERIAATPDDRLRDYLVQRRGLDEAQAADRVRRFRADPQALMRRRPDGINENYARELMELQTLGVDGGYTQQDVREVARAFTGWTIVDARGIGRPGRGRDPGEVGSFRFDPGMHDDGPKTVLGHRIDAGGINDGIAVIDLLASQPATARFIARKLVVKFVDDDPPPALVERVAAAFTRSDGDIRSTLRALFSDPEFFAPEHYRAKVRTPFELVVASLRALQADTNGRQIQAFLFDMGQPLYGQQAPTGYAETAADWVNSGALLKRMNFAVALAGNRIPGTRADLTVLGRSEAPRNLLEQGLQRWLAQAATTDTRDALVAQLAQPLPQPQLDAAAAGQAADAGNTTDAMAWRQRPGSMRIRLQPASGDPERIQVAALILGSPDFQRQ